VVNADVSFGPFLLTMIRFGGTLKDFPKLAKYADKIKVRIRSLP
jgi:hypothetical protein